MLFQTFGIKKNKGPSGFELVLISVGRVFHICLIRMYEIDDPFISMNELRTLQKGMYPWGNNVVGISEEICQ